MWKLVLTPSHASSGDVTRVTGLGHKPRYRQPCFHTLVSSCRDEGLVAQPSELPDTPPPRVKGSHHCYRWRCEWVGWSVEQLGGSGANSQWDADGGHAPGHVHTPAASPPIIPFTTLRPEVPLIRQQASAVHKPTDRHSCAHPSLLERQQVMIPASRELVRAAEGIGSGKECHNTTR